MTSSEVVHRWPVASAANTGRNVCIGKLTGAADPTGLTCADGSVPLTSPPVRERQHDDDHGYEAGTGSPRRDLGQYLAHRPVVGCPSADGRGAFGLAHL